MTTLKFKTTIKCEGCLQKATNALSPIPEIKHWEVDLNSSDKVLTIESDEDIASKVIDAIENAGFIIENF